MYKIKERFGFTTFMLWFATILAAVIIAVCTGVVIRNVVAKISVDETTEATSIDYKEKKDEDNNIIYKPIYHYEVNGKEYSCESMFTVSSKIKGKAIVHYDKSKPQMCMTDYSYSHYSINSLMALVIAFMVMLLILSFGNLKQHQKRKKRIKYLLSNGVLIKNIPHELVVNSSDDNPCDTKYVSTYKFPDGVTRKIESKEMYYLTAKKGSADLLYDPKNCDNYYFGANIEKI